MRILLALVSRVVGWASRLESPEFAAKFALKCFIYLIKPNVKDATKPISHYSCIHAFFTRSIRAELRPINSCSLVSPIDGTLLAVTPVNKGTTLEIKGLNYSVFELLSPLFSEEKQFNLDGYSAWHFYLSPRDYHRVHSPCEGDIDAVGYIPGTFWPVTSWALRLIPNLYSKNERVVMQITRPSGEKIFVVLVAALNVGNITLAVEPALETNPSIIMGDNLTLHKNLQWMPQPKKFLYLPARKVVKGDEIGIFHLGSTVILLSPDKEFKPPASFLTTNELLNKPVQFGQSLL